MNGSATQSVLFVGGTLHGNVTLVPVNQDIPPQYLNTRTGEPYRLLVLTLSVPSAIDPKVIDQVWRCPCYIFGPIDTMELAQAGFLDAAGRQWFTRHGHVHGAAEAAQAGLSVERFWASCDTEQCAGTPALEFPSITERARWMQHHIDTTGHKPTWSNEAPTPAPTDQGATE